MTKRRIRLTVRYDGTDFAGSQAQPGRRTVSGTLEAELESLLQQELKLDFAGRTDAGVHAEGNVCAFDAQLPFPIARLPALLNRSLPPDLVVREAQPVPDDFHPRFDARWRRYVYRGWTDADVPVDRMRYVGVYAAPWDVSVVAATLPLLEGRHSFVAYSAAGLRCEDSMCDLRRARVAVRGRELVFRFTANRFLRHMIVRLVGALAKVGYGQLEPEDVAAALHSGKRDFHLRPAPAKGLTLESVQY